jgi:hypothetical protein
MAVLAMSVLRLSVLVIAVLAMAAMAAMRMVLLEMTVLAMSGAEVVGAGHRSVGDGGAGGMAVLAISVLITAECLGLIAGHPDTLIGVPLVTPGCSTSVRWPWRCNRRWSLMMAMRRRPAMLKR